MPSTPTLIDRFGRQVTYVRLSVTDRCDFRCIYCMAEEMTFVPREQVLRLEEIAQLARVFASLGVSKIRLTGGEPLVRHNVLSLVEQIGALGLRDFAMTSNGSQLERLAQPLRAAGLQRINISLDSLKPDRFRAITRHGDLDVVLRGIAAAQAAGFRRLKINSVILRGHNDDEVFDLIEFAQSRGMDISFIEEMPLGDIGGRDRATSYFSSDALRELIETRFALAASTDSSGGPSRYFRLADSTTRIGFISPHSHNFCGDCNRVRVTAEGRLLLCLGNEHSIDLRAILRAHPGADEPLREAIVAAMAIKPERHHFDLYSDVDIVRFMNATGG